MKLPGGVPTYDEVMLPLLRISAEGPLNRAEATERVANIMQLTPEQRSKLMPKGHSVVRDRVGWARTYLIQAGLLRSVRRGVFEITDRGREWLARDLVRIDLELLHEIPEFVAFRSRSRAHTSSGEPLSSGFDPSEDSNAATPEERIDGALSEIDVALRETLLARIMSATPEFFERLVIELLVRMGYGGSRSDAARHLGMPGDGGVDGVIKLDKLGLDVVYIQAKRNHPDNAVSRPAVQAFAGALDSHGATRGVLMTTSYFTKDAVACAKDIRTKQLVLIDGEQLAELLIEHDVGVREDRRVVVKRLDEDYFDE